jgi:hypothetical protein
MMAALKKSLAATGGARKQPVHAERAPESHRRRPAAPTDCFQLTVTNCIAVVLVSHAPAEMTGSAPSRNVKYLAHFSHLTTEVVVFKTQMRQAHVR